jgi:His/Glu/Gln/Arg/opine family amino acid ABC transporter permease subunit
VRWLVFDFDVIGKNLPYLLSGVKFTLALACLVIVFGTFMGVILGLMKLSKNRFTRYPSAFIIEITRDTPIIMQMFFIFFGLPALGIRLNTFPSAALAMSLFAAGNTAEIVRGAIDSLPLGQFEAAKSLGMNYLQMMIYVIIPQALRRMIPPMMGLFTTLIKDTSLAAIIGAFELTRAGQEIIERTFHSLEIYLVVAAIYFIICYPLSYYTRKVEKGRVTGF